MSDYDPTTQPYDEPFRHVDRDPHDQIEVMANRIVELEAALHDAAELAFERRDEAAKAAKRIAELEAALAEQQRLNGRRPIVPQKREG